MFISMKSWSDLKIGHIGSKVDIVLIQSACQNVCHHEIEDKFETGSCQVKKKVIRSNLRKTVFAL